jgi:peptidoglycan/xylan/chitin deacetylase (PgdA/CDA1 family)
VTRFITFSFDDGMIIGAKRAAELLAPDYGTFFIVSDWVLGKIHQDHELLKGRDFGSLGEWRTMSQLGSDIQPHSATHYNLLDGATDRNYLDIYKSVAFIRQIHEGPYGFCCPFNQIPKEIDFAELGFAYAGFVSTPSDGPVVYNDLARLDYFQLRRWAVRERHLERMALEFGSVPDNTWTILGLHSLDGEGFEPWSSSGLANLIQLVRSGDFEIITASGLISNRALT